MGFTTIATTLASHIVALKTSGCSYNLNATRPSLHGHSAPELDNDLTLPLPGKQEKWIVASKDKHGAGRPFPPYPPLDFQLSTRFDILNTQDNFCLWKDPDSIKSSTSPRRRLLKEAVIRHSSRGLIGLATAGKPSPTEEDTTPLLQPTVSSIPHTGGATRHSPISFYYLQNWLL